MEINQNNQKQLLEPEYKHSNENQETQQQLTNSTSSYSSFLQAYLNIFNGENVQQHIKEYSILLIRNQQDQNFFQHFIQHKFVSLLITTMKEQKYSSSIVKSVFESLEVLLRGLQKQDQFVYFMVSISRQGLINHVYQYVEEQDVAYYANFLKYLARKINQDEKYLSIFMNSKQPQFPIMLNLLKFHSTTDVILHTTTKLTILELCQNPKLQYYILNFPFVIFYPCYIYPCVNYLKSLIQSQLSEHDYYQDNLRNALKYLQDFIAKKGRQSIDMYANTYFALLGRKIYHKILYTNTPYLMKTVHDIILKQAQVQKIRLGFKEMFSSKLNSQLLKYFRTKTHHLDRQYWLIDECKQSVQQHSRVILQKKNIRKSFLYTMNSYIPKSNSNWLSYQMRKLSQMLGVSIQLNSPIDHNIQNESSYLSALDSQSQLTLNPLYNDIIKFEHQQNTYWYLKICKELNIQINILDFINQMQRCTSLSLLMEFYQYIQSFQLNLANQYINHYYYQVVQKLVNYVLTEGWKPFLNRTKIKSQNQFSLDIFRDLECDIIYFLTLRHLLGTQNAKCSNFNLNLNEQIKFKQIKFNCRFSNKQGQQIYLLLDGQYIKLCTTEDEYITKQPLLLLNFTFCQDGETFQFLEKTNKSQGQSFSLYISEAPIRQYLDKQIKWRKKAAMNTEIMLKTLKIELN